MAMDAKRRWVELDPNIDPIPGPDQKLARTLWKSRQRLIEAERELNLRKAEADQLGQEFELAEFRSIKKSLAKRNLTIGDLLKHAAASGTSQSASRRDTRPERSTGQQTGRNAPEE